MSQEKLYPHALTIVDRIKDKLGITKTEPDVVLQRIINSITDFIENECNRRFKETTYTDEIYSVNGERQSHIFLKQAPVTALTSAKYRQGAIGTPTWGTYTANDYELSGDGKSGIVKFYTLLTQGLTPGNNTVKISYTAGYKISWPDAGNTALHTLPADLTELAERLVIKAYKKREMPGKSTEKFDTGFITWNTALDDDEKSILSSYRRLTPFV